LTQPCHLSRLKPIVSGLPSLINDTERIKNEERTLFMSPTDSKNTVDKHKKQAPVDVRAAHELTAKILGHLRMAVHYAHLAADHDEIFDNFGFDRSVEHFVAHAKDAATLLNKLRKTRGVTE